MNHCDFHYSHLLPKKPGILPLEETMTKQCRRCSAEFTTRSRIRKKGGFEMAKELGAEFIGTFMLVSSVCGAALFSAPSVGFIAVALSIGTAVLAMAGRCSSIMP